MIRSRRARLRLEEAAFSLLARQAPVAGDLRAVLAAIKNVADVERMSALALHVAKVARRRHPARALPEDVNGYFAEMGRIAVEIGDNTKSVVLEGDPYKAAQLRHDDDAMDELHRHLFTVLMDREWTHGVATAVDVTLLGRYYERFADHAVEIARRVIFQASGATTFPTNIHRRPHPNPAVPGVKGRRVLSGVNRLNRVVQSPSSLTAKSIF